MRVLLCHNYYRNRGGEDQSFDDEAKLLEENGHDVIRYTVHNQDITKKGMLRTALNTFWNHQTVKDFHALLRQERPALVHSTNLFPQISPSLYYAAAEHKIPVLQALRNYRMLCPAFSFMRDGKICEKCASLSFAWPAIQHACYRDSRMASTVAAGSFAWHRMLGTWSDKIQLFYTPSEFAREKFIANGVPVEKIVVKKNFVQPDLGPGSGEGNYALFVGRLSKEKGLDTLLTAWQENDFPLNLKIVGDGPLQELVKQRVTNDDRIEWLGKKSMEEVLSLLGEARFLVFPSIWYETFGRVIIEAYSMGTPVIASNLGAMAELIEPGETGFLFEPGNVQSLAEAVRELQGKSPETLKEMRKNVRQAYLGHYTPDQNYQRLMQIYEQVLSYDSAQFHDGNTPAVTSGAEH